MKIDSVVTYACAIGLCTACSGGSGPTGDVTILLEAEDTITGGLAAGTAEEDVIDGWSVTYDTFVATIGDIGLGRSATGAMQREPSLVVVDLESLPATGFTLAHFAGLEAQRWDVLTYRTPAASAAARLDASVPAADRDAMVAAGCTFLIGGAIDNPSGQSCVGTSACVPETHVSFRLCIPAATDYGPCSSPDGLSGIGVVAAGDTSAHVTLHGDHLWFNTFPSGAEGTVERRAQWLADCDADHDGTVTQAELEATSAAAVFTTANRYDLAGSPRVDGHGIQTAWDFVRAQMSTLGHFQGEGECPWAVTSGI